MATDNQLQAELAARLMDWPGVDARRMFGCDAFLVRGRLFAFFSDQGVVTKPTSALRQRLLEEGATPFRVRQGVPFGQWVYIPLADSPALQQAFLAVEESYRSVEAAPPGRRRRRS